MSPQNSILYTLIEQITTAAKSGKMANDTPSQSSGNDISSHGSFEMSSSSKYDWPYDDTPSTKGFGPVGFGPFYGYLSRKARFVRLKVLARMKGIWRLERCFARTPAPFTLKLVCIMVMMPYVAQVRAMPLPDADGIIPTTTEVSNGLWLACAALEAFGVIFFFWALKHMYTSLVWRDFLGVMSLVTSAVWTGLHNWDKAAKWRPLVLAGCHGLILNFTLQLCIGLDERALFGVLVLGFSIASALISSLFAALPSDAKTAAMDFSISNMIFNGFSRWATSPLYFTIWAILVKIAFYTCDAIQRRRACPLSTTQYGKMLMRIASFIVRPISCLYRFVGKRQADDGRSGVDSANVGLGGSNQELQTMPPEHASEPHGQASGHLFPTPPVCSVVSDIVSTA